MKNVAAGRPAHAPVKDQSIGTQIMRFLYSALNLGPYPADVAAHDESQEIEKHSFQILSMMTKIGTTKTGEISAETPCFEVGSGWIQFVQKDGVVCLRNEDGQVLGKFGRNTPRQLQAAAAKALVEYAKKVADPIDLRHIYLGDVDIAESLNFSNTIIDFESINELAKSPSAENAQFINLTGAQFKRTGFSDLFPTNFEKEKASLNKVDWSRFLIDRNLALQLIDAGADPTTIFAQLVTSERELGANKGDENKKIDTGVDISRFPLEDMNLQDLDLTGMELGKIIQNGSPKLLRNLECATLDSATAEMLKVAKSPNKIMFSPAPQSSNSLDVGEVDAVQANDGNLLVDNNDVVAQGVLSDARAAHTPGSFVALAYELQARHDKSEVLGDINTLQLRSYRGSVYYLGSESRSVVDVNKKDFREFGGVTGVQLAEPASTEPVKLPPVLKDQYDFFGVVIQALTNQPELEFPNGRFKAEDVDVLIETLPCEAAVKANLVEFLLNPQVKELRYPLHQYLLAPDQNVDDYLAGPEANEPAEQEQVLTVPSLATGPTSAALPERAVPVTTASALKAENRQLWSQIHGRTESGQARGQVTEVNGAATRPTGPVTQPTVHIPSSDRAIPKPKEPDQPGTRSGRPTIYAAQAPKGGKPDNSHLIKPKQPDGVRNSNLKTVQPQPGTSTSSMRAQFAQMMQNGSQPPGVGKPAAVKPRPVRLNGPGETRLPIKKAETFRLGSRSQYVRESGKQQTSYAEASDLSTDRQSDEQ